MTYRSKKNLNEPTGFIGFKKIILHLHKSILYNEQYS